MRTIYVSGPLSNCIPEGYDQFHGRWQNELDASRIAQECIEKGWAVICPHKNTSGFYHIEYEKLIETDLELVRRCDAILMFGKWQLSPGALREIELAQELGKDVFFYEKNGVPHPYNALHKLASETREAGQGGMNSTQLIGRVEDRYGELEHYKFDWRSFYNGWLEGRGDLNVNIRDQGNRNSSVGHAAAYVSDIISDNLARRGRGASGKA